MFFGISYPSQNSVNIEPSMLTRHGIISGATGTGKTISLQVLAEQFARQGISVFTADAKGDLSGISQKGTLNEKIEERLHLMNIESFEFQKTKTVFWDIYGEKGHPIRTTVLEMGPILLGRLLRASEVQQSVLHVAFTIADEQGLLLVDLKDLQALLAFLSESRETLSVQYGNISDISIASLQRQIIVLKEAGGDLFFGEKAFDLHNLLQKDVSGKGVVHVLDAQKLVADNRVYSTFLLWLLSELFEELPEVGDLDQPKMVFFFDEAHLLFEDAPDVLIEMIERVVRLIRSKGVGIYFVTQNPLDIPEKIRAQLANRVQHALRAFTPLEQKAIKSLSETFRPNPEIDVESLIGQLKVGHALVSFLNPDGEPNPVEHVMIRPPEGQIGAITEAQRIETITTSSFYGVYETRVDNESAYEILSKRKKINTENSEQDVSENSENSSSILGGVIETFLGTGKRQGYAETFAKQVVRSVGTKIATQLIRGILGSLKK